MGRTATFRDQIEAEQERGVEQQGQRHTDHAGPLLEPDCQRGAHDEDAQLRELDHDEAAPHALLAHHLLAEKAGRGRRSISAARARSSHSATSSR